NGHLCVLNRENPIKPSPLEDHMNKSPFECSGCGEGFNETPPKCPKCGTFRIVNIKKIFAHLDTAIGACRMQLEEAAELVTTCNHRKARFIVTQLRRAKENVEVALRAVHVDGSPAATKKKVSKG
ncbi:MAG: hypothetical protein FWD53_08130, partial [Phycisphaerales bacterium]|nr:hypothetical protein [Phycisphaerales bacterium]